MIIDTHSHLNFNAYKKDFDEVAKRAAENGVHCINVGSNFKTSRQAVEIAKNYNGMYAAVGLHPNEGEFLLEHDFDKEKYKELAKSKKVVAIGEIGLDYYYKPKTNIKLQQFKEAQKKVFIQQLDLAKELNLPAILHCRMAHQNLLEILKSKCKNQNAKLTGTVHCFTGTIEEMREYLGLGFYIGFNGIIFKLDMDEAIKQCPLERILVETDCPYLTPPQEGNKRNEPIFVKHIIQKIAELKDISFQELAEIATQNARKLFKI